MYLPDGERLVIFASKAGAPTNPAWYHNLLASPSATVEVGSDTFDVDVSIAAGEERERLFNQQSELMPQFVNLLLLIVILLAGNPRTTWPGYAIVASGIPVYFLWRKRA